MGPLETLVGTLDVTDATGAIVAIAGLVSGLLLTMLGVRKFVKTLNRS